MYRGRWQSQGFQWANSVQAVPSSVVCPLRITIWSFPEEDSTHSISYFPMLLRQDVSVDIHGQAGLRVPDAL